MKGTNQRKEILPGMEIIGLTLYLRDEDALVFSDLHLGFEEELRHLGFLVPRFQYDEIVAHLLAVFSLLEHKPGKVIINGDLKHEFSRISQQEWKEVLSFLDFLQENCGETILVKGNHDTILGPVASRKNVTLADNFFFEKRKIYVTHGHRTPRDRDFAQARTVVIGHNHPAITLSDGVRTEKTKCFLKGVWEDKNLIQMPSLNFITEGSDLLREEVLSPFLKKGMGDFEAYCVEGLELLYFGKLKNL